MPLRNLALAEEALSLPPSERADLAKLLINSLENEGRSDAEISIELNRRLDNLLSGNDAGLNFEQVFGAADIISLRSCT
jgi:putative addiction module component (TIGR02574 family)